ncbi:MAG TPA: radical SAM protein, partial [Terriglobia bacterium]|nr:radical SAM protein [Terriglobia bacterium]
IDSLENSPRNSVAEPHTPPPLPYHRVNVRQYIGKTCLGTRTISYHSSFGCPFLCGFCAVAAIYKGRWTGKPASTVGDEVLWLRDRYGVNAVEFIDNNFFVAEHRTAEIARRLRGSGITWWGEARPDTVMEFSDATWHAMRDGGCKMIFLGAESSSDEVLAIMNKGGAQTPDTVLQLAERSKKFGIVPEFSFVLGTPSDDVDAQIERDIRYIRRIKTINPQSEIVIYLYSPVFFQDAELLQRAGSFGFEFPKRLTEWLDPAWQTFDLRKDPKTPWLEPRHIERIMNFERVLNARFPTISDIKLKPWQTGILKTLGSWRYKVGFYLAPWEIRFVANRLFRYRQPEIEGF